MPFTVTASASDDVSGVANVSLFNRYSRDNSTWGSWENFSIDTNGADGWSWGFTAPNGYGYYEFYSIATDRAGNVGAVPSEADARCVVLFSELLTDQGKEEWIQFITIENILIIAGQQIVEQLINALINKGYMDLYLSLEVMGTIPIPELPVGTPPITIVDPLKPIPITPTQEPLPQPSPSLPPVTPSPVTPAPAISGTVIVQATAVSSFTVFVFLKVLVLPCDVEIIAYDPAGVGHPLEKIPETEMWILDEMPIQPGVWTFEIRVTDIPANAVFWAYVIQAGLPATVNIDPNTLNLKSKGRWVTGYIELPKPFNVRDIDISRVTLGTKKGVVFASTTPTDVSDFDGDGIEELMVKFDRRALINIVGVGDQALTISGMVGGTPFLGQYTIRVK